MLHGMVRGCDTVSTRYAAVMIVVSWWGGEVGVGRVTVCEAVGNMVIARGRCFRLDVERVGVAR